MTETISGKGASGVTETVSGKGASGVTETISGKAKSEGFRGILMAVMTHQRISFSVDQTHALAQAMGRWVRCGDLVALVGELGAGKTQWVRGMLQGMGGRASDVASPTFVLMHEYPTAEARCPLVHVDAYRIASLEDLESVGFEPGARAIAQGFQPAVVAVEWADRLGDLLDRDHVRVHLEPTLDHPDQRRINVTFAGAMTDRADALGQAWALLD